MLFALWEPPLTDLAGEHGAPVRRSATAEAADLLADLVADGVRTVAFVRSRAGGRDGRRRRPGGCSPRSTRTWSGRVAAYRAGYLPEERRALEADLQSGRLLGVASTNALELGVDIAGLDAVLLAGYPGTRASLWQQAGRAGRAGQGRARGAGRPRRPAGHLPRSTTRRRCSAGRSRRRSSTRTTPTSWRRTCAPRRPSCR